MISLILGDGSDCWRMIEIYSKKGYSIALRIHNNPPKKAKGGIQCHYLNRDLFYLHYSYWR